MLADTPWTFPLFLAWATLSLIAPLLLAVILVLSAFRSTRGVGLRILFFGVVGAIFGCIGEFALGLWVREGLSQSTAIGRLFASAGSFSLLDIPAGIVVLASFRKKSDATAR
jgi:hypothetical protein